MVSLMIQKNHVPVMVAEVVEALGVRPGGRYIDGTVGAGGHAAAVLEKCQPGGSLLGFDADPQALAIARERLAKFGQAATLVNDNFSRLEVVARENGFISVDGILLDLGLSSMQLDEAGRGFSFQHEAPLDMRFGPEQELTAGDIVNHWSERELADVIYRYGEERLSRRIARGIVSGRPVFTTTHLASIVEKAVGGRRGRIHPATRTFQALRIAVNGELENLETVLAYTVGLLGHGGRLVVISYHSLEDRIVKQFLKREAAGCACPSGTPVCQCGRVPTLSLVLKKVVTPSLLEVGMNPRSRSARMRVAERLGGEVGVGM
jgi:16S rRNA (cytosine1402-N4)-methyltransferase